MKFAQLSVLCALIAGFGLTSKTHQVHAQGHWSGDRPVFQSEIDKRERERKAERAKRRKSYKVSYPKYMKGGAKPNIEPEEPPIVYLNRKERPGSPTLVGRPCRTRQPGITV